VVSTSLLVSVRLQWSTLVLIAVMPQGQSAIPSIRHFSVKWSALVYDTK